MVISYSGYSGFTGTLHSDGGGMKEDTQLKVLIVEDEPEVAETIGMILKVKLSAVSDVVNDCPSAREKLSGHDYDLITLDYLVPGGNGLELLREINSIENPPPVVMVTRHGDENTAVEAFKNGASGYVVKDVRMSTLLVEAVLHALSEVAHKRTVRALKESEARLREIYDSAGEGIVMLDNERLFTSCNKAAQEIFGYGEEELIGHCVRKIYASDEAYERYGSLVYGAIRDRGRFRGRAEIVRGDGEARVTQVSINPIIVEGRQEGIVGVFSDVTERMMIEEELVASKRLVRRKLDAMGEAEGYIEPLELSDILDVVAIQSIMDDFFALTNIGVAVLDLAGTGLVATGWQDICTKFHRIHPGASQHCLESDLELSRGVAPGTYKLYKCKNNMWDMVTPITVAGEHVGNLYLGQFFFEDEITDQDVFIEQALKYGFDIDEYLTALERVPRWSRETVSTVMGFYTKFTKLLSSQGYSRIALARALAQTERLLEERKRVEQELQTANLELEAYAHTVSHDLKGPMATIFAASEMLRDALKDVDDDSVIELVGMLERNAKNTQTRADELLKLAESGQRPLEVEDIDMDELVHAVVGEFATQINQKGINVSVGLDMGRLIANRQQLRQVFSNLLSNAIKHNDSSAPQIRISRLAPADDGAQRFLARDNGSGVPSNEMEGIFVSFQRGEKTGETGIGLAITKRIAQVYSGDVIVYNDQGACFEVTLKDWELPQH